MPVLTLALQYWLVIQSGYSEEFSQCQAAVDMAEFSYWQNGRPPKYDDKMDLDAQRFYRSRSKSRSVWNKPSLSARINKDRTCTISVWRSDGTKWGEFVFPSEYRSRWYPYYYPDKASGNYVFYPSARNQADILAKSIVLMYIKTNTWPKSAKELKTYWPTEIRDLNIMTWTLTKKHISIRNTQHGVIYKYPTFYPESDLESRLKLPVVIIRKG